MSVMTSVLVRHFSYLGTILERGLGNLIGSSRLILDIKFYIRLLWGYCVVGRQYGMFGAVLGPDSRAMLSTE